nr:TetR/AcrR family transcriptional regulator [Kineosporia mesophila]
MLDAAERLYAEHGLAAVSNRQISEAAGQANTAAVSYHFGSKTDLLTAITRRHAGPIDVIRQDMLDRCRDGAPLRDRVACLVTPLTRHLDDLGPPTWYARFSEQLFTDPQLRAVVVRDGVRSPTMVRALNGLSGALPVLPPAVRLTRSEMARSLLVHVTAEHERALAHERDGGRPTWQSMSDHLVDAMVGLLVAPTTQPTA